MANTKTSVTHHEDNSQKLDQLLQQMEKEKNQLDGTTDPTDDLLSKAIELAIEQGRGWKDGEKEEYMRKIGLFDDDYLPPIFATSHEDLEKSGMKEAFTSLMYDDPPAQLMLECKKKGNAAFQNGKQNVAGNIQYFRDAINHYYESFFWADKVVPDQLPTDGQGREINNVELIYTKEQLDDLKSNLYANAAMAHLQLKNWGHVRDDSKKSLTYNAANIKAWYRLAKAYQMLQHYEDAGDAIESGLRIDQENADLKNLQKVLQAKVQRARTDRQKRERLRAERVQKVKDVWKYCKDNQIRLGRIPLVTSVSDENYEDEDDDKNPNSTSDEARWHHHFPHSGKLPIFHHTSNTWTWPVMFLYPSHRNSDFIEHFEESEMLALRMAQIFPELEDTEEGDPSHSSSSALWDYNREFKCSQLAVYFEVHCTNETEGVENTDLVHPDSVELLRTQADTMRFYESSRALKGDEGDAMAEVARCIERKHLYNQRKMWKKKHGSLWALPDPCPIVRVHPACTLGDILRDKRMVIPNFLVTLILFPESHPAHEAFLQEHKFLGVLKPKSQE